MVETSLCGRDDGRWTVQFYVIEQMKLGDHIVDLQGLKGRYPRERYEVGLLWREEEAKLTNNFYSAMGQFKSLERRLQKDDMLRNCYQETIDTDVKAGYVRKVQQVELNETRDKLLWYLPHHSVINTHKEEKVRRVCNAATKYQGVALNDKLLPGPDLLHNPDHKIEVYEYTRQVFGSPTCANYALNQVAKDIAKDDENLVKIVQRNFYMDDSIKSVRTPQEAIEIYQKVREVLSKGGFDLTNWLTSDEEVKSQIPEADRPTKVVKTFEDQPQSSSILGLNWNEDADSLIVCR
ncbi:uncharacterized protein LOC142355283 [Convolutriloba macropyga]|uniref:uncharacterized protein LOC142355283 n=1 Tax=Convolutriloba macropyga TaxID=536237 RepID=UPI003F51DCEF